MATTLEIRSAIRTAAKALGVSFKGKNTYTDSTPSGTYVGFPMPYGESGKAGAIATEANFLLFTMTGERNVVRVVRSEQKNYTSGRAYLRATAK